MTATSKLIGPALDWAVAQCEGFPARDRLEGSDYCPHDKYYRDVDDKWFCPSEDWSQGGPIIEREGITLEYTNGDWIARIEGNPMRHVDYLPLFAAMRCYVASKLGDEVEIPEELK